MHGTTRRFERSLATLSPLAIVLAVASCRDDGATQRANRPFDPVEPPPCADPFVDSSYAQEVNHTTNELEPGIGELVSVLIPELASFENPTQVTPRGLVTHDAQGSLHLLSIEPESDDLRFAAFFAGGLVMASPAALHVVTPDLSLSTATPSPGITILGVAPGAHQAYVLSDKGLGFVRSPTSIIWPSGSSPIRAAVEVGSELWLGTSADLSSHPVPAQDVLPAPTWILDAAHGLDTGPIVAIVPNVTLPVELDAVVIGELGLAGVKVEGDTASIVPVDMFAPDRVPLLEPTAAAPASDGGFIVATRGGAYRVMDRGAGPEWRVYGAERWLPGEDVRAVASDRTSVDAPVHFATSGGLATVSTERMTLEEKMNAFVDRIVLRHDRDGAVADSRMSERGDLSTSIPWDSDNDGGWTSYWLLAECFRYRVTGDPEARAHFDKSLDRMLSLRTLTGTEHFLARAVIRKEGCRLDDCDNPDDGEWFTSPDGEWWVKGDTSNDEVTSHMFMMGHAFDLCANDEQRGQIRAHVDGIVGGIVDHGYRLVDLDGKVTSYGQFDPGYVNVGYQLADGGRRSAQMLAALNLAEYLTGSEKYRAAKRELIEEHHYDVNAVTESEYVLRKGSGDGDELATQAFFVLIRYERDASRRAQWLDGWSRSYGNMRLQQAALWDVVNGVVGGPDPSFGNAGRWLQLAPMDMIRWQMHNSHRKDLIPPPAYYHQDGAMRSDGKIIPPDERPNDRFNTDQFRLDGGLGPFIEMDGAEVLAAYWMARYYGFIVRAQ